MTVLGRMDMGDEMVSFTALRIAVRKQLVPPPGR